MRQLSPETRTLAGIGLAFLGFAILSGGDVLAKYLSARYSIFEITTVDSLAALSVVLPLSLRAVGPRGLIPNDPTRVVLRAVLGAVSAITGFLAFSRTSMADVYSIAFATPLIVTALSMPLLGERVDWRQWSAVLLGFAAVLFILRPGFAALRVGQMLAIGSTLTWALSLLLMRRIAQSERTGTILTTFLLALGLICAPIAAVEYRTPSVGALALMAATGLCTGLGNLSLIQAFRLTQAATVSSFQYSQLLWGVIFGLLLFGDRPNSATLLGSAVIALCGLYTLWFAVQRSQPVPAAELD